MQIQEMEQKIERTFFVFYIIAFELGGQFLSIPKRILVIDSQCVNKRP